MKTGGKIALGVIGVLALGGIVGNIGKDKDDNKSASSEITSSIDKSAESSSGESSEEEKSSGEEKSSEAEEKTEAKEEETNASSGGMTAAQIAEAVNNGDYSLVTPSWKETMDAYEAFYDDYIAFMNKYNSDTNNMLTMLDDYNKMTTEMMKWSEQMDAVDQSTLTPADDAYYLLVTLRVEKKLLECSYGMQ